MGLNKARVGTTATLKAKKAEEHFLLARGLSARYAGANTPLASLTGEEMERDLRHMEAFSNACTAYAQQYYIYQNQEVAQPTPDPPAPLVAMPVRIDPEEEKRLLNLRQKIQHCEAQREVLESQYLSLRGHYVHLSQRLKSFRGTVTERIDFLRDLVGKRGALVALQRARLQISRETLACLQYRQDGGKTVDPPVEPLEEGALKEAKTEKPLLDLMEFWNELDEQFKAAEDACRSGGVMPWQALKVPKVPPGVPLLLSTLAKPLAFAAAWSTGGMFGSKPESMTWLQYDFSEPPTARQTRLDSGGHSQELPALREEVDFLKRELERERSLNTDFQSTVNARRQSNDDLVSMMALLRTETEAVIARHNILLDSNEAKEAALRLQQPEESVAEPVPAETVDIQTEQTATPEDNENDGDDEGGDDEEEEGEALTLERKRSHEQETPLEEGSPLRNKRRKL